LRWFADLFERCRGEVDASGFATGTQIHDLGGDIITATGLLCTDHLATGGTIIEFGGGKCDDVVGCGVVRTACAKAWLVIRSVAVVGMFAVLGMFVVVGMFAVGMFSEEEGSAEG